MRRLRWLLAIALLALLVVGGVWLLRPSLPAPPPLPPRASLDAQVAELLEELHAKTITSRSLNGRADLATAALANGNPGLAEQAFLQVLAVRDDPTWWYLCGRARVEQGDLDGAATAWKRAADGLPSTAWLETRRGFLELDRGELAKARAAFVRAQAVDASAPGPVVGLARVNLHAGQPEDAAALLERLVEQSPHPYFRQLLGRAYQQLGRFPDAARVLTGSDGAPPPAWPDPLMDGITEWRRGYRATFEAADRLADGGRPDQALAMLQTLRTHYPHDATLLAKIGETALFAGNLAAAERPLKEAVAIDPDLVVARLQLARWHLAQTATGGALAELDRLTQINPDFALAYRLRADVHLTDGDLASARTALEQAVRCGMPGPQTRYDLAAVSYHLGDRNAALLAGNAVLRQHPEHIPSIVLVANVLIERGSLQEAEPLLARAQRLAPGAPEVTQTVQALLEARRRAAP